MDLTGKSTWAENLRKEGKNKEGFKKIRGVGVIRVG